MQTLKISFTKIIFTLVFSLVFSLLSFVPSTVLAVTTHNMSGYAWSSNIGWISFNSTDDQGTADYGVNKNTDGTLVGYAWSSNIGWIQFGGLGPSFPSGAGTTAQNAQLMGSNLVGWARAIGADGNGWDGWIALSGSGYGVTFSSTTNKFAGYAWGGDVVGWIKFDVNHGVIIGASVPSGTISATDCTIPVNASTCTSQVTWTTVNLTAGATEVTRNNNNSESPHVSFATSGTGFGTSVNQGYTVFYIYHNISGTPTELARLATPVTASCAFGSIWNRTLGLCEKSVQYGYCFDVNNTRYSCFQGESANHGQTDTTYTWTCKGSEPTIPTHDVSCELLKGCGDGVTDDALGEECDKGTSNSDYCPSDCSSSCKKITPTNTCKDRPLFIEE